MKEFTLDSRMSGDFTFEPFDAIVVRKKPGFEFQEYVTIGGEVAYPGRYAIREGEKVGALIRKAGGLTKEAFPQAASFSRQGKGKVFISIDRFYAQEIPTTTLNYCLVMNSLFQPKT